MFILETILSRLALEKVRLGELMVIQVLCLLGVPDGPYREPHTGAFSVSAGVCLCLWKP